MVDFLCKDKIVIDTSMNKTYIILYFKHLQKRRTLLIFELRIIPSHFLNIHLAHNKTVKKVSTNSTLQLMTPKTHVLQQFCKLISAPKQNFDRLWRSTYGIKFLNDFQPNPRV